jgi:hypothetical protein
MSDPIRLDPTTDTTQPMKPWAFRLLVFMRIMALLLLAKGLFHWWQIVSGPMGFEIMPMNRRIASVYFAVVDLVAAVGLWFAAGWGGVMGLLVLGSLIAVEVALPQTFGLRWVLIPLALMVAGGYVALVILASREDSD